MPQTIETEAPRQYAIESGREPLFEGLHGAPASLCSADSGRWFGECGYGLDVLPNKFNFQFLGGWGIEHPASSI